MVIRLETKRLILRKPRMSDLNDLVEGMNNLNISKNLVPVPYPYTTKDGEWYLNHTIEKWNKKEKEDYTFLIELKSEKKLIGAIGLHKISKQNGTAETGSWINENYWKKGYMTEAKIAANDFAFNELGLRKLFSPIFSTNKASIATQKRMGYVKEGLLKQQIVCRATGQIHDEVIYSLFKETWNKNLPLLKKYFENKYLKR